MTTRTQWLWLTAALAAFAPAHADAQVRYPGTPYGYQITNGRIGPGYGAAYGLNARAYAARGGTVTDYQPLINAITSIPGWYGPAARPPKPIHPHPAMARDQLLGPDGKILWPSAAPDNAARRAAEAAVAVVVQENQKYGHATVRHVVDARNKLTAFAGQVLPSVKTRNAADADGLERFIVELQKTLATMAVNY